MIPVSNPILIFALAMAIFLLAPLVFERYKLPGIVGIIVLGALIGPQGAGILERDQLFVLLGEVGLVYLMFIAGLEINFNQFVTYKERSVVFGLLSFLIPQLAGTVVGISVLDLSLAAALLFGAIFSSHTVLAYPLVSRFRLTHNEAMTTTVGGTILTDTLALLVLAVVMASVGGEFTVWYWAELFIGITLVLGGIWFLVPRIGAWFFSISRHDSITEFLFVLAILFLSAFFADVAGIKHIIGAFIVGLAFNRLIPKTGPLMNRLEFIGYALFIPFFLVSVGMLVDLRTIIDTQTLLIAGVLIGLVITTKFIAAFVTGVLFGYSAAERWGMFGLSVGQAAAALAIVLIAFNAGVAGFDQPMLNAVVMMIFVISIVSPIVVERAGAAIRRAEISTHPTAATDGDRMLIPLSSIQTTSKSLLDVAILLRGQDTDEPLFISSVVTPSADIDSSVATVDSMLLEVETYASGAAVPIESRITVDEDTATGIRRTIAENQVSTLVLGWDGTPSRYRRIFGSILDRVIEQTMIATFVATIRQSIEPTENVIVILPANAEHAPGFTHIVSSLEAVSEQLSANVEWWTLSPHPGYVSDRLLATGYVTKPHLTQFTRWNAIRRALRESTNTTDLIVLVSARRESIGWHNTVETIPSYLATYHGGNFLVVFPADPGPSDDRRFFQVS